MALISPKEKTILTTTHTQDGELRAWVQARIVRSNHDLWTLELSLLNEEHAELAKEHILISPSQIDTFRELGVPVSNPIPEQPLPKKRVKRK